MDGLASRPADGAGLDETRLLPAVTLTRAHRTRLLGIWRSAGWPCRDALEIDLLAAGLVALSMDAQGRETLRLTDAGIRWLAEARRRNVRALSAHDRLAERLARRLAESGRIVWRELTLRARLDVAPDAAACAAHPAPLWAEEEPPGPPRAKAAWRLARPDVFSVRNTSVEAYLQPMVHEVKVSRADLQSDLRNEAKRRSYQWLCCECHYVFPAAIAEPQEIPEEFGVWLLHGGIDDEAARLEMARPARHSPCKLPFAVWLALAKATPVHFDDMEPRQCELDVQL